MKNKVLLTALFVGSLCANDILNETQKEIIKQKEKKAIKEAEITKDSWINPLNVEISSSKIKGVSSKNADTNNKASIGFDQDIYRSGAIFDTIKKGKVQKNLKLKEIEKEEKDLIHLVYSQTISLRKIDLEIMKLFYLIQNKNIEIHKKEEFYTNGIVDISDLDNSIIELSDLRNQIQDLKNQRLTLLTEFEKISNKSYRDIALEPLSFVSLENYVKNNRNLKIEELNLQERELDEKITKASFMPKVSVYSNYSYEDYQNEDGDSYQYGVKLSMPIDFNAKKKKEEAKLNKLISKLTLKQQKEYEMNFYKYTLKRVLVVDKKIANIKKTIKRYNSLYARVKELYENSLKTIDDVEVMKNSLESSKLDIKVLELTKKEILNELFKRI